MGASGTLNLEPRGSGATAPQGAAHQLKVSLVTLATVPRGQFGGCAANSSFIISLWPRGCRLVLLRSENDANVVLNARTLGLFPSRNSALERCCYAVSFPSMPTGRSLSILINASANP